MRFEEIMNQIVEKKFCCDKIKMEVFRGWKID